MSGSTYLLFKYFLIEDRIALHTSKCIMYLVFMLMFKGDSGGPLIVTKKGNQCVFYALGITSFGKGCGGVNLPAIYTKVASFIPWIERTVW